MTTTPTNPLRSDPVTRKLLVIWGIILILSGGGIGAGVVLLLHPHHPPKPHEPVESQREPSGPPEVPNFDPKPIVDQMTHELQLTPDQAQAVTSAYSQSLKDVKALRDDMLVKLTAEHDKLREAMKKILNPQQYAQWDERFERMRSRFMPDAPHRHEFEGPGRFGPNGSGFPGPGPEGRRPRPREDDPEFQGPPRGQNGPPEQDGPPDGNNRQRPFPPPNGPDFQGPPEGQQSPPPSQPAQRGQPNN